MSDRKPLKDKRFFKFGNFRLDTNDGLFADGKSVKLTPKVLQTLIYFVKNRGRVIHKEELFGEIWGDTFVEDNAISFNISQLRKALANFDKQTVFIETLPKRGFRFIADVEELETAEPEAEIVYERYETKELIAEEMLETDAVQVVPTTKTKALIKYLVGGSTAMIFLAGVFFIWQNRNSEDEQLFDLLQTKKLTSWSATRSSNYADYRISNDGRMIAYSSTKNGSEAIYLRQVNGSGEIRITEENFDAFNPVWSPNDEEIAFTSLRDNRIGVYVSSSLGGTNTLLKNVGQYNIWLLKWSRLTPTIFYEDEGNLFALHTQSKEVTQLTNLTATKERRYFSLSPDETVVAYRDTVDGQTDIWLMALSAGNSWKITDDKDAENRIDWHPDGQRLPYDVLRDGKSNLSLGFASGKAPHQITRGDNNYHLLDISKDGTRIFYTSVEERTDIGNVNLASGRESGFVKTSDSEFWVNTSPDGKYIAYQSNTASDAISKLEASSIVIKNTISDSTQIISRAVNPEWSPDSRNLAFYRWDEAQQSNNLWLFDVGKNTERKLTADGIGIGGVALFPYYRNQTKSFSWSADSRKIAYIGYQKGDIYLLDVEDGTTRRIFSVDRTSSTLGSPQWSKNARLAFSSVEKPSNTNKETLSSIYLWENDSCRKLLSTPSNIRLLGWSADGNSLYYLSAEDALKAAPMDVTLRRLSALQTDHELLRLTQIMPLSAVLSPNTTQIAFVKRNAAGDDIFIAKVDQAIRQLTANPNSDILFGNLNWSADESGIYFDKHEKLINISFFENFK